MNKMTLELVLNGKRQFQEIDVCSYVKKPIEKFVFLPTVKDTRVPLTYVHFKKIFSNRNIKVNNLHETNKKNVEYKTDVEDNYFQVIGGSLTTEYNKIKVTNILSLDSKNKEIPLFYVHRISNAAQANIEIKTNMSESVEKVYKVDIANNSIYHNYYNYFDEESGKYRLYYVNWIDLNGNTYRELLDSKDVVYELTWEDIDPFTGQIKAGVYGYEKTESPGSYTYYFNNSDTYYWSPTSTNYMRGVAAKGRGSKEPWYLEIQNGSFSKVLNNTLYKYRVNEYYLQDFAPAFPYSYTVFFELDWVNSNTLKSDTDSIHFSSEKNLNVDIFVYDEKNVLKRVLTTDKTKGDKRYEESNLFWEADIISSIDEENGFIELKEDFHPQSRFKGSFFYEKRSFEFKKVNLNPIYNRHMKECFYVFYCIPNLYNYETSIHYLRVNKAGIIEYCSQGDGNQYERANYPCLSVRDENGNNNINTIVGSYYKGVEKSFVSMYGSEGNNKYRYQVLCEVSFRQTTNIDEILSFDVREKGGVLKEENKEKVFRRNSIIMQSEFGYGPKGFEYTKWNCLMIEVPMSMTEEYGGVFTKKELLQSIENKTPSFSKNFIKWVYPEGTLKIENEKEGEVKLLIGYSGKGTKTVIYKRERKEEKDEVLEVVEVPKGGLIYLDENLESNRIYYYCIAIIENGYEYPKHNKVEVFCK